MIDFPEDYFKTEIRDGFEVSSMMKRAWAGLGHEWKFWDIELQKFLDYAGLPVVK